MIFAIKQYLSTLKESKELDALLPNLLLVMGITPISKPQVGVRQYGVDIFACGTDSDRQKKVFLFVIKQGNIGRQEWNGSVQSIYSSLTEIRNIFISQHIPPKYKNHKIKIVLCTGGDMLQEMTPDWNGYIKNNQAENIEYDFWGGDELAQLVTKHLFNEHILLPEYQSYIRKTLALLVEPAYDMSDYYTLLEKIFVTEAKPNLLQKKIRALFLVLNIVYKWAEDVDNLKPALLAAERTLLLFFDFLRKENLLHDKKLLELFLLFYHCHILCQMNYFNKVQPYCHQINGLHGFTKTNSPEIEGIALFEQLGIISVFGLCKIYQGLKIQNKNVLQEAEIIKNTVTHFINNHKSLCNPLYDMHINDISLAIFLLSRFKNTADFIKNWIIDILQHISFAYNTLSTYFPVFTDDFNDLISENAENKEKLFSASTLLFILLKWLAIFGNESDYKDAVEFINKTFPKTTFQEWYPTADTEEKIYNYNAGYFSGLTSVANSIPKSQQEMIFFINQVPDDELQITDFSCSKCGILELLLISSRHFRTPIPPDFLRFVQKNIHEAEQKV